MTPARGLFFACVMAAAAVSACGWDPSRPFEREAPQVKEAISHLDGGDARAAVDLLADYLTTGKCEDGNIGTPDRVRERPQGSFDLGLALFEIAEAFGRRFGDEERDAGAVDPNLKGLRSGQVECALRIVRAASVDATRPAELRARAHFLEGNLLFLNGAYEEAVRAYDKALEIAPGMGDGGPLGATDASASYGPDPIGRDAAWNRAIAIRRIEDKKDAGQDASSDASNDGGGGDAGNDKNQDGGGGGGDDAGKDSGQNQPNRDGGDDSGGEPPQKNDENKEQDPEKEPGKEPPPQEPPPASRQSQDDRILDQLENAPTVQQEAAKRDAKRRRVRGMEDK